MKLLFVCTGNTCRSCMAEAIFNSLNTNKDITAFSAGISVAVDSKTSENSAKVVFEELAVDIADRRPVQLSVEHIWRSDLILTMTMKHRDMLKEAYPEYYQKIFSINEFAGVEGDIMDPYGASIYVYKETYDLLKNSIGLLVAKLGEDMSI